jgi:hypothetical protein|tara:strand:+ start:7106 stop:7699 length:594 start_codon:yes stop_codon:yes gene_type:complete
MDTKVSVLGGLQPARIYGSGANSTGMKILPIASGDARNIFKGDLVKTSLGNIEPVSAAADYAVGVFQGVYYESDGVPKFNQYWPANTSATNIQAHVMADTDMTYYVMADASCSAGDIYLNFALTLGAGNTATGISGFGLKAATRVATTAPVKAVGVKDIPGNDIDVATERAFPIMAVKILRSNMNMFDVASSVVGPI